MNYDVDSDEEWEEEEPGESISDSEVRVKDSNFDICAFEDRLLATLMHD